MKRLCLNRRSYDTPLFRKNALTPVEAAFKIIDILPNGIRRLRWAIARDFLAEVRERPRRFRLVFTRIYKVFMKEHRSVALLVETSNAYSRGLLVGILDFAQRQGNWSIFLPEQERGASPPAWLSQWKGDGIIARIETDQVASAIRKLRLPVVDLSAARHMPGIPWAETDDKAITRLGVEHFMERGFEHFAFCGDPGFAWSNARCESFTELLSQHGLMVHTYQSTPRYDRGFTVEKEKKSLGAWVQKLPRPIAIMACYDFKAQQVLDVCRELEIAVPEEIAVLGVDNDELMCEFASPPLSSVIHDTYRTGLEAAMLLEQMMATGKSETERLLTEPLGICTRQSTDVLATKDREVAMAMQYIREHANHNIRVADLLRHVPMSRRVLEARFRKAVRRSPHEEIQRMRINRVRQLLNQPELSVAEVARLAGYEHPEYMAAAFRRQTGQTPSQYRDSRTPQAPLR